MRLSGPVEIVDGTADVTLQPSGMRGLRFLDERHGHDVRAGFHGSAKPQARLHSVSGIRRFLEESFEVFLAADRRDVNALAVNREFDIVWRFKTAHDVEVRPIQLRLEDILAIERKIMEDTRSADRSKRQAFDMLVLRKILTDAHMFHRWG